MVRIHAGQKFYDETSDPKMFVDVIVGPRGLYDTPDIENFLRGMIVSRLTSVLGSAAAWANVRLSVGAPKSPAAGFAPFHVDRAVGQVVGRIGDYRVKMVVGKQLQNLPAVADDDVRARHGPTPC